ncbi:MAG: 3,4-dihydroxy-2-butanone-4-phosphate synthase [Holophagaceae bacterium]|nr:3,4-dihydroxy-2-butanone-4-phosphate synthase [Holophagaceae bacterium]
MSRPFAPIEDAIQAIANGKMVVVVDDEGRENEGDLTMAAQCVTPEAIAFMATHGRGLICTALEGELLDRLNISQMVQDNSSPFETAFCVSVEAREGTTTGISAHDRARTIQALISPQAKPGDFVKPGHTFPLRARPGGVLTRTGQTEASVDLARLAGLHPSGVICEVMKDDGSMARVPDLDIFCRAHDLLMVTVADIIAYRLQKDPIVRVAGSYAKETQWGPLLVHKFQNILDKSIYLAFQIGDVAGRVPLVRVHLGVLPDDLGGFGIFEPSAFHASMAAMQKDGCGVLVFLHHQAWDGIEPVLDPANREVGIGAQILGQLGITKMRLLTRQEKHYAGLKGFGLDIVAYVQLSSD